VEKDTQEAEKSGIFNLGLAKNIAKYFMDFLETDFHKRKTPKRSIKLHNSDNLLLGINLNKYPKFENLVWHRFVDGFKETSVQVPRGVYRTNLPKNLIDVVKLISKKISEKDTRKVQKEIIGGISESVVLHQDNINSATNYSLDKSRSIIRKSLVTPFVKNIEKSLEEIKLGDENTVYLMEEELTDVIVKLVEGPISEFIKERYVSKKQTKKEISLFTLKDLITLINDFFEEFQLTDLHTDLNEIDKNKNILDKQEIYFYFIDISFDKSRYPLFYIPAVISKRENDFYIEFDSQLYVNKKAIEFIVQQYNTQNNKRGSLKDISERIIYLSNAGDGFKSIISNIINEISDYFDLEPKYSLDSTDQLPGKSLLVSLTPSCHICLFDKSDEALINDYEEILELLESANNPIAKAFLKLIDDFIHKDPDTIMDDVDNGWDGSSIEDKLVFESPIPLNSEQRKIVSALNSEKCSYVAVEGPPGTGKSHTITSIIFNAILSKQSVLVLSDKKEALDVVEDKITDTINKVRVQESFQNPILRLGKIGNTYQQILSPSSIENIRASYMAAKKNMPQLLENQTARINTLREDIEAEKLAYSNLDKEEVNEYLYLDKYLKESSTPLDIEELANSESGSQDLDNLFVCIQNITELFNGDSEFYKYDYLTLNSLDDLHSHVESLSLINESAEKVFNIYAEKIESLKIFEKFKLADIEKLENYVEMIAKIKLPILGYIFSKEKLELININLKKDFPDISIKNPHKSITDLKNAIEIYQYIANVSSEISNSSYKKSKIFELILYVIGNREFEKNKELLDIAKDSISGLRLFSENFPECVKKSGVNIYEVKTLFKNKICDLSEGEINKLLRYLSLNESLRKVLSDVPEYDYLSSKKMIERLVTYRMAYILDESVSNFYTNSLGTAKTFREIIRKKKKFPKDDFNKLKESFPCILAGIRDYSEYIPLVPELFDLVIIDEASQVSVAQAFPAILRAKRVLILGDQKQFSNVKSVQARSETNQEYVNHLVSYFKQGSGDESGLTRLSNFNIKTSILEFFDYIANFKIQLKKYFRGYKEIISYSNKNFYLNSLQVMKVRSKPIGEVITFKELTPDGKDEILSNSNTPEVQYIIEQLNKMKDDAVTSSVGIITPHTNQQKLLNDLISQELNKDYFYDKLKLKIMTFDTCQGEERDIIFYSMVATEKDDKLWGVFPKDINGYEDEYEGKIKVQRLNVGFSRAKEKMSFVISKPLESFRGSIGEALRHYKSELDSAKKEPGIDSVDKNSPMEVKVLHWLTQTKFYNSNKDNIEIKTQFKLGEYLKQLDPYYTHPSFVVDFLIVYKNGGGYENKLIIEYDGFEFHFNKDESVNELNYEQYYTEDDIYRQKTLEGYGYKFIRLNRFNIGKDPINELDKKIDTVINNVDTPDSFFEKYSQTISNLSSGEEKECPKCKEIHPIADFEDRSLISGIGRFCNNCKSKHVHATYPHSEAISTNQNCPLCGSKMILRSGKYGKFYGCSRFPYCRGTRKY
jgi:ssDNA-binding Zn-finger/Zn-ribbon topoisomerase 1